MTAQDAAYLRELAQRILDGLAGRMSEPYEIDHLESDGRYLAEKVLEAVKEPRS